MASESFEDMMDTFSTNTSSASLEEERRSLLRIDLPFPAVVRGVDANGHTFEEQVVLDNLSANGLALRLRRCVKPGERLFIVIWLALEEQLPAPRVAVLGIVQRAQPTSNLSYSLAIMFTRYRFLYVDDQ